MEGGETDYDVWTYECAYDEQTGTMQSTSRARSAGDYKPDSEEQVVEAAAEYADARFLFNDEGLLTWDEPSETADDAMVFQHTIGWVDPGYVGPGHHFVGEWKDEKNVISITETMESYEISILDAQDSADSSFWIYSCDYDADTDTLVTNGTLALRYDYQSADTEDFALECAYEDGEAVFSLNGEGMLVWEDRKEGAGEGRTFAPVPEEETDGEAVQATGKVVEPMVPEYDFSALADGTYPVSFERSSLADGALTFTVCSQDVYDIVDINTLEVGDVISVSGTDVRIESLERGEDLIVNGGLIEDGFVLRSFEEDNCWKVVLLDDYNTYTERGEATLPLADDVTFTDGWDIEKDPVTVTGAEAVAAAIAGTEMDYFDPLNATVRVEGGKIVEIQRDYIP